MKSTALRGVPSSLFTNVCCDIGMDKINLICPGLSRPGSVAEWEIANRTDPILETLLEIRELTRTNQITNLRVVVEPTGIYHKLLLGLARQLGFATTLVDASHV